MYFCGLAAACAAAVVALFLVVPVTEQPLPEPAVVTLTETGSRPLYRDVRVTNVSGHPGRVAVWLPHAINASLPDESTCCQFVRDGAHWVHRNEPYRIYQPPDRAFVTMLADAGKQWADGSGGHRILGAAVESARTFDNAELLRTDAEGVNFVARADLRILRDEDRTRYLGVTRLIMDEGMKHIYQWGVLINAAIPNICDAVHDESCYDLRSIVVHEIGHVYGLDDLYNPACVRNRMYWQLDTGETRGRQLDELTEACVTSLYAQLPVEGEFGTPALPQASEVDRRKIPWFVMLHLGVVLLV